MRPLLRRRHFDRGRDGRYRGEDDVADGEEDLSAPDDGPVVGPTRAGVRSPGLELCENRGEDGDGGGDPCGGVGEMGRDGLVARSTGDGD